MKSRPYPLVRQRLDTGSCVRALTIFFMTSAVAQSQAPPCSLTVTPSDGLVDLRPGSDATFVCRAMCLGSALSRGQLVWRDPHGNLIETFGRGRIHAVAYNRWRVNRLIVTDLQARDSGLYTCEVRHGDSLLQYTALLQVQDSILRGTDTGPKRGDIFIEPEPDFSGIRPVRSAADHKTNSLHGNDDSRRSGSESGPRAVQGSSVHRPAGDKAAGVQPGYLLAMELDSEVSVPLYPGPEKGDSVGSVDVELLRVRRQAGNSSSSANMTGPAPPPSAPYPHNVTTQPPGGQGDASDATPSPDGLGFDTSTADAADGAGTTSAVTTAPPGGANTSDAATTKSTQSKTATTTTSAKTPTPVVIFTTTTTTTTATKTTTTTTKGPKSSGSGSEGSGARTGSGGQVTKSGESRDEAGGESDFGRYGMLAFGLTLGIAILLLYALLLVVLVPRCCKRRQKHTLSQEVEDGRGSSPSRHNDAAAMGMGERPHKPLAPMTSAAGLNGEYITSVDLDTTADQEEPGGGGEGGEDGPTPLVAVAAADGGDTAAAAPSDENYLSTFLIGRLSSSKPADADLPLDVTVTANDDNVFGARGEGEGTAAPGPELCVSPPADGVDSDHNSISSEGGSSRKLNTYHSSDDTPTDGVTSGDAIKEAAGDESSKPESPTMAGLFAEINLQITPEGIRSDEHTEV